MSKELDIEAKEMLYSSIKNEAEKIIDEERRIHYKAYFLEAVDVEAVEDDGDRRVLLIWKNKLGKHLSIKNIKLNFFKLLKGMVELYVASQILDEIVLCSIINALKLIIEVCMVDLSEEEIVIILAIYYEVRGGRKITDSNLCDKVNLYIEDYMGVKLPMQRIYKDVECLYERGIVEIDNGEFRISDREIVVS